MEPFIGQIMQVGFNFAPAQWAVCGGQILPISQNTALFSLLGTNFGGNGQTTFGLPNLQGRVIIGSGQSTGSFYDIGEIGGQEYVTINYNEMPAHTHTATFTPTGGGGGPLQVTVNALQATGTSGGPAAQSLLASTGTSPSSPKVYAAAGTGGTQVALGGVSASGGGITGGTVTVAPAGGSVPTNVLPPYQSVLQIIALAGIFPSRG